MKPLFHVFCVFVLSLAFIVHAEGESAEAKAEEAAELARLRVAYQEQRLEIGAENAGELKALAEAYKEAVQLLHKEVRGRGKLDDLIAVKNELERFGRVGTVAKADLVSGPEKLLRMQKKYVERAQALTEQKDSLVFTLVTKYLERLEKLQGELTRVERIDDALAVRAEIQTVRQQPDFLAAKASAGRRAAEPVDGQESGARLADEWQPHSNASDGVSMCVGGTTAARSGGQFRPISLHRTEMSSLSHAVSCRAWIDADRQSSTRRGRSCSRGAYRSKSSQAGYSVRLMLRSKRAGQVLKDQVVVVQYFTEGAGKNRSPGQKKTEYCMLDRIDAAGVSLEFPGVSTKKVKTRYRGSYYSRRPGDTYTSGSEFSGVIVSVFDKDGNLTFQSTSSPKLKARGAHSWEQARKEID